MNKKKYRWNYKKCFKNLGAGLCVVALSVAVDVCLFLAFFSPVLGE